MYTHNTYRQRRLFVTTSSLALPAYLYPVFAPLSASMANHLVLLEYRLLRKRAVASEGTPQRLWKLVEERVRLARALLYEYMNPFVQVEQQRMRRGLSRRFPEESWLLDALATYAPDGTRYSPATLELWQKKRLLRRERPRGMFDLSSVAALLITRIAEGEHQRNWLPSALAEGEPDWWCYQQTGREATRQPIAIPLPLPTKNAGVVLLSTPWLGAGWLSTEWHIFEKVAVRWSGSIASVHEMAQWDAALANEIVGWRAHSLLGRQAVQRVLLQEAGTLILERVARIYNE